MIYWKCFEGPNFFALLTGSCKKRVCHSRVLLYLEGIRIWYLIWAEFLYLWVQNGIIQISCILFNMYCAPSVYEKKMLKWKRTKKDKEKSFMIPVIAHEFFNLYHLCHMNLAQFSYVLKGKSMFWLFKQPDIPENSFFSYVFFYLSNKPTQHASFWPVSVEN